MRIKLYLLGLFLTLLLSHFSLAKEGLKAHKISNSVYAIVGALGNRSPENLGNNATFGLVLTSQGAVLIDSGGTFQGAKKIHAIIKSITDIPIVMVINTGGQDHRWLGNQYFQGLGAEIISSNRAVADQKARLQDQFFRLGSLVGETVLRGTNPVYANKTFDNKMQFVKGDITFELYHVGQAHTPGDVFVWLPKQKIMFTGDIVYTERMLGIGPQSNSKSWLAVYQTMAAYKPKIIVPGHGRPTSLDKANTDTYEYLNFLRQAVADFIEKGGDMAEIKKIDQSQYRYLLNFDSLSGRNAQKIYSELEWE